MGQQQLEGKNRRQYRRYNVKDVVFLTFRPQFEKLGKLRDISRGGVSFEYITQADPNKPELVEVDIFSHSKDFHLSRVSCKVVYDVCTDESLSFSCLETRRCGLQFKSLSSHQASQLNSLIKKVAF